MRLDFYLDLFPFVTLIVLLLYYKAFFGVSENIVMKKHFPKGYSSLEAIRDLHGYIEYSDVGILLLALINKGYIGVKKSPDEDRDSIYTFYMIKAYDGNITNEKRMMKGLFHNCSEIRDVNISFKTMPEIQDIYDELNSTGKKLRFYGEIISYGAKLVIPVILLFMSIIYVYGIISSTCLMTYPEMKWIIYAAFFISILITSRGFHVGTVIIPNPRTTREEFNTKYIPWRNEDEEKIYLITEQLIFIWTEVMMGFASFFPLFIFSYELRWQGFYGIILSVISIILMHIIIRYIVPAKPAYTIERFKSVSSVITFLKQGPMVLKDVVESEPSYLYDMMPYIYGLGLDDKIVRTLGYSKCHCPEWCKMYTPDRLCDLYNELWRMLQNK